jgi:hypothetical protein
LRHRVERGGGVGSRAGRRGMTSASGEALTSPSVVDYEKLCSRVQINSRTLFASTVRARMANAERNRMASEY